MSVNRNPVRLIIDPNFTQIMINGQDIAPWVSGYEVRQLARTPPELILHIPFVRVESQKE